jgi:hypothetical protein
MVKVSVAMVLVALLAGCGPTRIEYRPVPLPLPLAERPVLTPIAPDALQCLAPATYTTIVNRERGYKTWGLELEATIKANNAKAVSSSP